MNGLILTNLKILNYIAVGWFYLSDYGHFQRILLFWVATGKILSLPNYGPNSSCKALHSRSFTYVIKE